MDNIDKREARSETKINSRFTRGGKGDVNRTTHKDFSSASLWCDCGRMKDKCRCFPDKEGTVNIENGKITGVDYD